LAASPVIEAPITNTCGYNQAGFEHGEDLCPVHDLLLEFSLLRAEGGGQLLIRATDGAEEFLVRIDPRRAAFEVLRGGRPLPGGQGPLGAPARDLRIEVSLVDRQFLLAFNGRPALLYPYNPPGQMSTPVTRPFAIGAQGLGVRLSGLRLFRDVYYTRPTGVSGRWGLNTPVKLSRDEYFVLGDNSPVSDDSRSWSRGPQVASQLLIGKPLIVDLADRFISVGQWQVQVPDLGRIRYIR